MPNMRFRPWLLAEEADVRFMPFFQRFLSDPGDGTVRMVAADWLDENDESDMAALLRLVTAGFGSETRSDDHEAAQAALKRIEASLPVCKPYTHNGRRQISFSNTDDLELGRSIAVQAGWRKVKESSGFVCYITYQGNRFYLSDITRTVPIDVSAATNPVVIKALFCLKCDPLVRYLHPAFGDQSHYARIGDHLTASWHGDIRGLEMDVQLALEWKFGRTIASDLKSLNDRLYEVLAPGRPLAGSHLRNLVTNLAARMSRFAGRPELKNEVARLNAWDQAYRQHARDDFKARYGFEPGGNYPDD